MKMTIKVQVAEITEAQKISRVHVQQCFVSSAMLKQCVFKLIKKNVLMFMFLSDTPDPNNVRQEAGAVGVVFRPAPPAIQDNRGSLV